MPETRATTAATSESRTPKNRLSLAKANLDLFETFFATVSGSSPVAPHQVGTLARKFIVFESLLQDYKNAIADLVDDDPDHVTEHAANLSAFEDQFCGICFAVETFLEKNKTAPEVKSSLNSSQSYPSGELAGLRLPPLDLPSYSGKFENWTQFSDTFTALIHNNASLSNVQKLHYLVSCLKGEAAISIASLKVTNDNYTIAWDILKKRFENKKLIVKSNINALFNLEGLRKDSHSSVQNLLDSVVKILEILKAYGEPTADTILIHIIVSKLSSAMQTDWELCKHVGQFPTLRELLDFLENKSHLLGSLEASKIGSSLGNQGSEQRSHARAHVAAQQNHKNCPFCKEKHWINGCASFSKLSVNARIEEARRLKLCMNCLKPGHFAANCSSSACRVCGKRHHTLLCLRPKPDAREATSSPRPRPQEPSVGTVAPPERVTAAPSEGPAASVSAACSRQERAMPSQVLLSTVNVLVEGASGSFSRAKALLDPGSQLNLITEGLCQNLNLEKSVNATSLTGVGAAALSSRFKANVRIRSRNGKYNEVLSCVVLERITDPLPVFPFSLKELKIPPNIALADSDCNVPGNIDLLLGANVFWQVLCQGQVNLGPEKPFLTKTLFGWVLGGNINVGNHALCLSHRVNLSVASIEAGIQRFWEVEGEYGPSGRLSSDDEFCENHFRSTTKRALSEPHRFIVNIPFKKDAPSLGDSRNIALKRFYSLESKLSKNPELKKAYSKFLEEYESLGHLCRVDDEASLPHPRFYFPHLPVIKEDSSTTKHRVVFDGSCASSSGVSFNDLQHKGPVVQQSLFAILCRFRQFKYVLKADCAKMYRQILVDPSQTHYQLILWREEKDSPVNCFKLLTVTYGTKAASYLATRCLIQIAQEIEPSFPEASRRISRDFYVDDLLTGFETRADAIKIQAEINNALSGYGFELRKWASNDEEIASAIGVERGNVDPISLTEDTTEKTLGIFWDTRGDVLSYRVNPSDSKSVTKRAILSSMAQVFDPLGLIGPSVLVLKLLVQRLWQLNLSWDETVPMEMRSKYDELHSSLHALGALAIPRRVASDGSTSIELHGFADASSVAYGCAVYIRCVDARGNVTTNLLCAKSRVAPLKTISLPRLELCAALLLARLVSTVLDSSTLKFDRVYYWSDSTITLHWINKDASNWKTFVANRVSEIHELSNRRNWLHVRTNCNPADIISRGMLPQELAVSPLWWYGPEFLSHANVKPQSEWVELDERGDLESRPIVAAVHQRVAEFDLFKRYSSFSRLQRVVAYCLRFASNRSVEARRSGPLSVDELENATRRLVKIAQVEGFSGEIVALSTKASLPKGSTLLSLNVFLDDQGLLRVGGRLESSNLTFDQKHPILLPAGHPFSYLIVRQEHLRLLHCGHSVLLSSLRDKFWIVRAKNLIRKVIHECVTCFRAKPRASEHLMGSLPEVRITPSPPFSNCGIDYAGPVFIKNKAGRGSKEVKAYVALFVCLATKAIHLELVEDLTTEAFIASLRRFISRRGLPANIFSDNATCFTGAKNQLSELKAILSGSSEQIIREELSKLSIKWSFIPARSPHFGGIWEAGVKSLKYYLRRISGNARLTFVEYYTMLTQVEAILNSRPLCVLPSDASFPEVLSPAHFLIGRKLTSFPEPNLQDIAENRLNRYQLVQRLSQQFWDRWSRDYLHLLQRRPKWKSHSNAPAPQVGDVVLVHDEASPSYRWPLAVISATYPGADSVVRVVQVRDSRGNVLKRSVRKIYVLPRDDSCNESAQNN